MGSTAGEFCAKRVGIRSWVRGGMVGFARTCRPYYRGMTDLARTYVFCLKENYSMRHLGRWKTFWCSISDAGACRAADLRRALRGRNVAGRRTDGGVHTG
jgi:hypothetical protein